MSGTGPCKCWADFVGPLLFRPAALPKRGKNKEPAMGSVTERRKHARSRHPAGSVSREAQQRVNERVRDVMARGDAAPAQRRDSHSDAGYSHSAAIEMILAREASRTVGLA
jgi:hypothetical protein